MSSFVTVFRREFLERRNVIFTALAASLIPILVPLLPLVPHDVRAEMRTLLAQSLAMIFAVGVAIITGVSLFSRDLVDGRASLFLSRPIGQTSIWGGKIVAGIVLALTTFWIITTPSLAIHPEGWDLGRSSLIGALVIPLLAGLLLLLAGNAIGIMVRSRKLLVLADFVLAVIAATAGWIVFLHFAWLTKSGGLSFVITSIGVITAVIIVVLLIGAWVQTAVGRADIARAHRALSFTIWPLVFGLLALFAGFVWWLPRVSPADLELVHQVRGGSGGWLAIEAEASSRPAAYTAGMIVDTRNPERYISLDGAWQPGNVTFSHNGRWAAWQAGDRNLRGMPVPNRRFARVPESHLALAELDTVPTVRHTDIRLETSHMAFSDDGRLLAIRGFRQVTIYDTATLKAVGSVRISAPRIHMFFMPDGELRLLLRGGGLDDDTALVAWNAGRRRIEKTGVLRGERNVVFDSAGTRVLVVTKDSIALRNGRTGALTAELLRLSDGDDLSTRGTFLRDGRVIVSHSAKGRNTLRLFAADGTAPRDIPLPPSPWVSVDEEVTPGVVLVLAGNGIYEFESMRTLAVDVQSGRVTHVLNNAIPVSTWSQYGTDPRVKHDDVVTFQNMRTGAVERLDLATWKTLPLFGRTQ